ncbi:MAG: hypothetical protein H5U38_02105, partial [Calditrichaeota bacterium]|nr:hypothetical protein [Calditrichota bacterium]
MSPACPRKSAWLCADGRRVRVKQPRIGVLALQGDFEKHQQMLAQLDVAPLLVKTAEQLRKCQGLIIPGGESTTLSLMLRKHG